MLIEIRLPVVMFIASLNWLALILKCYTDLLWHITQLMSICVLPRNECFRDTTFFRAFGKQTRRDSALQNQYHLGYVFHEARDHYSLLDIFGEPLFLHGLTLTPTWIHNCIHYKVWDNIVYPFSNSNSAAVDVFEWISNFHSIFHGACDYLSCWDQSYSMSVKDAPALFTWVFFMG